MDDLSRRLSMTSVARRNAVLGDVPKGEEEPAAPAGRGSPGPHRRVVHRREPERARTGLPDPSTAAPGHDPATSAAIKMAVATRGGVAGIEGVTLHIDRGSTCTANGFTELCRLRIRQSTGPVGSCSDNAAAAPPAEDPRSTARTPPSTGRRRQGTSTVSGSRTAARSRPRRTAVTHRRAASFICSACSIARGPPRPRRESCARVRGRVCRPCGR